MRKILFIFVFFIFISSVANAISLNDSYLENSLGTICTDISFLKDLFDANGEQTPLTDCYKEIVEAIKERIGLDIDKDVEHIGLYLTLDNNEIQPIFFLSGNFNMEGIIKTVKESIASEPELFKPIEINGKKKPSLQIDQNIFVGQNHKTIWCCDEYALTHITNKNLSFVNAPDYVSDLLSKSNNFIILKKELWSKLFGYDPTKLNIDLDSVSLVSVNLKNYDLEFEAKLDSQESAEVLKLQLEYLIKSFKDNKETLNIDDTYTNIFKKINSLYLSARITDILNSLKMEVEDNSLIILFPYNRTNFYNAASDFITNIAMPAYQKIIEERKISACYHTQHLITKAIDRYNSENEPMMTYYDNLTLSTSDSFPYEYSSLTKRGCKYISVGNLDNGGYISCEQHGPAKPLIKPQITKERYDQENEMLLCFDNMREIKESIGRFNSKIQFKTNRSKSNIDSEATLITTELNLELLKENGFLKENYYDLPNCEYYIKGDINTYDNGYIGCKKHGLLTYGQLHSSDYIFSSRRPNLDKKDVLKQIKKDPERQEEQANDSYNNPEIIRKCRINMRDINTAIDMYNMDSSIMMETQLDLPTLIKGKYLRKELEKPTPECEYYIEGDISKDGCIACKKHGSFR